MAITRDRPQTGKRGTRESTVELSNLQNIEADLHMHSEFSDGVKLPQITDMAQDLGLRTMSVTDHVRQTWDDVDFYNKDAYLITVPGRVAEEREDEWLLANNMDVLDSVVEDWRKEFTDSDFELESSFEQDYESWNENLVEDFLSQNNPDFVPLSVHYIPLEEWDKAKYFRMSDFDDLSDDACFRAVKNYFSEYEDKIEFGSYVEEELGVSVIHTHMDGVLRNENLRPHVVEEDFHRMLDKIIEEDAVVEANARVVRKLAEEYEDDELYKPEDAEWFTREVARRADEGELEYVVSSDAHSAKGMKKNLLMADRVVDDYGVEPLNYERLVDRTG